MIFRNKYKTIWELARPYLDTRNNDLHARMSTGFAYRILDKESGDEAVVIPAIMLHDVGWKEVPEELQSKAFGPKVTMLEWNRIHEVEGVKIAEGILERVHYDQEKIQEILVIIDGHDSRNEPVSLNDRIVKDADKLFRYTREGFIQLQKTYGYTFRQYLDRLRSHLNPWFLTATGRQIAMEEIRGRMKDSDDGVL